MLQHCTSSQLGCAVPFTLVHTGNRGKRPIKNTENTKSGTTQKSKQHKTQ